MPTDFRRLIEALADGAVDFVVIGGVAVAAHGHVRATLDLDLCYSREPANLERIARAVGALRPTLRGAPPDLPFVLDARTLRSGLNFTLRTTLGDLDLFGEVPGVGTFADAAADAEALNLFGRRVLVLSLARLERAKRAAGRAKDLLDLEAIRELRKRRQTT